MPFSERVNFLVENYKLNPVFAVRVAKTAGDFTEENIMRVLTDKPKPFVKWVGGKRQLISQFREKGLYPPNVFDPQKNTYFEPFVGGGAVFFDLLPLKASINDVNTELIITYKVIRDSVEDLINELNKKTYSYNKEIFLKIRSLETEKMSDLKRAARFIYLNKTAFNGLYRVNSKGKFNVPFGKYSNPVICDEKNLKNVSKTLQGIEICNFSYKYLLDKAKRGDFIYFDPPYYPVSRTSAFTAYSKDNFLENEQKELRDTFTELHKRGCFVMLSNSDTPYTESLFKPLQKEGVYLHKVQAGRAINSKASKRGKIFEILVTNYL